MQSNLCLHWFGIDYQMLHTHAQIIAFVIYFKLYYTSNKTNSYSFVKDIKYCQLNKGNKQEKHTNKMKESRYWRMSVKNLQNDEMLRLLL